jgi:hypothetical protein
MCLSVDQCALAALDLRGTKKQQQTITTPHTYAQPNSIRNLKVSSVDNLMVSADADLFASAIQHSMFVIDMLLPRTGNVAAERAIARVCYKNKACDSETNTWRDELIFFVLVDRDHCCYE